MGYTGFSDNPIFLTLMGIVIFLINFTPSYFAYKSNHSHKHIILILNIILLPLNILTGITIILWIALVAWARDKKRLRAGHYEK